MNEPSVSGKNLTKSFSGRRVVDNLSFDVQKGQVFALLGHNGAGKSTTIDLILGLKAPEAGSARILGMDAAKNRKQVFARVGVQLQNTQYQTSINSGADEEAVLLKKKSELLARIADLTRQIAVVDGYLSKKRTALSSPVLVKIIPETTVAYMRIRLESYDCLFDRMPEMGVLMEQAGCECALPEYCFTNYLEPGYKDGDILVEICESVVEAKKETGDLHFKTLPEIQAACVFHRGSYRTFSESYETVLRYIEENGYEIAGEIRESYIDGVWNQDDESAWLSEIQVPVRRKTE